MQFFSAKRFLLLAVTLSLAASALAFPPHGRRKRDVRAEVEAADVAWRTAEMDNNLAALDRMLSDDYLGIMFNGQVLTKAQQIDRARSRQMHIEHLTVSDVKIKLLGHTAVLTSLAEIDGENDGRPFHGMFRSTRIYHLAPNEQWQLISFEATPIRHGLDATAEE